MQTTVSRWIPWVKAGAASASRPNYSSREVMTAVAFVAPSLLLFSIWIFYPLVRSVYLSFHGNDLFGNPAAFVGLAQYQELFTLPDLRETILRTAIFTVLTVVPGLVLGTLIALSLQARIAGIGIFRTLFATPFAFSVATASVIFQIFFNPGVGVFNGILNVFHVAPVGWLTNPATALASVAVATVWLQLGYNVLVLSSGLQGIPDEIYEAARLDGARGYSLATRITLPMLTPTLFFLLVVSTIAALQSFGQIHILTRGGPASATTTLVYSVYLNAFAFGSTNYGLASAMALVLFVIVIAVTAIQFGVLERRVFYR
ncbi:MAG TPA: sugar ABC transporter permease [Candidatus Eisenbacteria bacterium]|nr:sugar ABC transporter permease [Candidatus Eisenbacteria bacterium]